MGIDFRTHGVVLGQGKVSTPSERALVVLFDGCISALMLLAAGLAWYRIGHDSFWLDEAAGIRFSRAGWAHLLTVDHGTDALYYALLKVWLPLTKSEAGIRFLSLLPFVLTVPTVGLLVRRLRGERLALLAAAIVACHPLLVRYGQEARGYSLVTFLVTAAVLTLTVGMQDGRPGIFLSGTVLLALSAYAHPVAALTGVSILTWIFVWSREPLPIRRVWIAVVFTALISPLAIVIIRSGSDQIGWTGHGEYGGILSLGSVIWQNLSGTPAGFVIGGLAIVGVVLTVMRVRRFDHRIDAVVAGLPLVWIVGTGVLVLVASAHQSLLVPRYLLLVVPAIAILAAEGAFSLGSVRVAVPLVVAVAALNLGFIITTNPGYRPENWRAAEDFIAAHAQPGDTIAFAPTLEAVPFEYYQVARHQSAPVPILPAGTWGDVRVSLATVVHDSPAEVASRAAAFARYTRGWMVIAPVASARTLAGYVDATERAFATYGARAGSWRFGDISVVLYGPATG